MRPATKRILISRTDSIGDVVLTLPMAGALRQVMPDVEILFLGQTYTVPIIQACEHTHRFYNWDEVKDAAPQQQADFLRGTNADIILHVFPRTEIASAAHRARIPLRIGTTNRMFHWTTCNKLVWLSRRNSPLHEAQLNLRLLRPLGAKALYTREDIANLYGLTQVQPLKSGISNLLSPSKINLILHPTSKGSALEWGIENFIELIHMLPQDQFNVFITGTKADGQTICEPLQAQVPFVHDMTGKLTLNELLSFIAAADGLVAASTGPLHLSAALGKVAVGLYPSRPPIHPGRWAPLGAQAYVIEDGMRERYSGFLKIEPKTVLETLHKLFDV